MITIPYPLFYRIMINDYNAISSTLQNNNEMNTILYPLLYRIIINDCPTISSTLQNNNK